MILRSVNRMFDEVEISDNDIRLFTVFLSDNKERLSAMFKENFLLALKK